LVKKIRFGTMSLLNSFASRGATKFQKTQI